MLSKALLISATIATVAIAQGSSWDDYLDILKGSSDSINEAAITGDDGSVFTRTSGFPGTDDQLKKIAEQFNNYLDFTSQGIIIGDIKYIVPYAEQQIALGKKGKNGVYALKTTKTIIIALFSGEGGEAAVSTRSAIEKLGQYLTTSGF